MLYTKLKLLQDQSILDTQSPMIQTVDMIMEHGTGGDDIIKDIEEAYRASGNKQVIYYIKRLMGVSGAITEGDRISDQDFILVFMGIRYLQLTSRWEEREVHGLVKELSEYMFNECILEKKVVKYDVYLSRLMRYYEEILVSQDGVLGHQKYLMSLLNTSFVEKSTELYSAIVVVMMSAYLKHQSPEKACALGRLSHFNSNDKYLNSRYYFSLGLPHMISLNYRKAYDLFEKSLRYIVKSTDLDYICKHMMVAKILGNQINENEVFMGKFTDNDSLEPYFSIAKAITHGDIATYETVVDKYSAILVQDDLGSYIPKLKSAIYRYKVLQVSKLIKSCTMENLMEWIGSTDSNKAMRILIELQNEHLIKVELEGSLIWFVDSINRYKPEYYNFFLNMSKQYMSQNTAAWNATVINKTSKTHLSNNIK